jgi:hypothetical protein
MWRGCNFLAPTIVVWGLSVSSTGAIAQAVQAICNREGIEVICDVRPGSTKQISDVSASSSGKLLERTSLEVFDQSGRFAEYYFLIQHTSPLARDAIQAIDRLTKDGSGRRVFGVATFTDRLEEQKALGATAGEFSKLKDSPHFRDISERNADRVDLYGPALEAIEKLKQSGLNGTRKALVIIADGRSKDRYERERFLKAANSDNVLVYAIYLARKDAENSGQGDLERLASDANGIFLAAQCERRRCELDEVGNRDFFNFLERGVRVRYSAYAIPGSSEVTFSARFADNTIAQSRPVPIRGKPLAWWDEAAIWVMQNPVVAGGAAAGTVVFLALTGVLFSRRRTVVPAGEGQATYATGSMPVRKGTVVMASDPNPSQVYAWLQFLDADASRVPVSLASVRIGRHQDNDIVLQNKTVHRQHAILHMNPDKRFLINDLGGENGTMVNGERCVQCDLQDGDLIELGEVRLRFFSNFT